MRHSTRGRSHFRVRLACVKHAASVQSEPESNSPVQICTKISAWQKSESQSSISTRSSLVNEPEKEFLRHAAARHLVFNYSKIADYYAHTSPEMQRLMEKSALVIIDFDDAIANGYVRLSENIKRIMDVSGEKTK